MTKILNTLLEMTIGAGATDLHVIHGRRPILRRNSRCLPVDSAFIHNQVQSNWPELHVALNGLHKAHLNYSPKEDSFQVLRDTGENAILYRPTRFSFDFRTKMSKKVDDSVPSDVHVRVRFRRYFANRQVCTVFRIQPATIPPLSEIIVHKGLQEALTSGAPGLFLITGGKSSGKTTLQASILEGHTKLQRHVRTLESPIEYIIPDHDGLCTQLLVDPEGHGDEASYLSGLHNMLADDADILGVGEVSTAETLHSVIHASTLNFGVFATLHSSSCGECANRVKGYLDERPELLRAFQKSLRGIISIKLEEHSHKLTPVYQAVVFSDAQGEKDKEALLKGDLDLDYLLKSETREGYYQSTPY